MLSLGDLTLRVRIEEKASHSFRAWVICPMRRAARDAIVGNLRNDVTRGDPERSSEVELASFHTDTTQERLKMVW